MQLIKQSYEIVESNSSTINSIYKDIERAGRLSHKSEDKITEDSAKEFVERMLKLEHYATLEFGTVYLKLHYSELAFASIIERYNTNPYSRINIANGFAHITTNMRAIVENGWQDDLKLMCEPSKFHIKRYCVKFICSRSISHELVRHRVFSFIQESQRYCAYDKNKFKGEVTFIEPVWFNSASDNNKKEFIKALEEAEEHYLNLRKNKWKAEEAREVLPNSTKTELYMCGFSDDWEHFFKLRTDSNAHPMMRELTIPLYKEFKERKYINTDIIR